MTPTTTQKTPSADLAGCRAEGQIHPPTKEMNMHQSTVPTRLDLDGFTTDVDPADENVNLTFTDTGRWVLGITIPRTDARRLATALLDASAPNFGTAHQDELLEHVEIARKVPVDIPVSDFATGTVTDVFRFAREHDMPPGDVMQAVETYMDGMAEVESLTPAKWCQRHRQQNNTN